MLRGIINFFIGKKPKKHHFPEKHSNRKENIQKFSMKIEEIRDTLTESNVQSKAKEFYALVKSALKESLDIKYEATFQEILKEINEKQHFSATLREDIKAFLDELILMEYGREEFRKLVEEKRHQQEKMLKQYINELESEGEHIKSKTKKKISEIVSENIPHNDKEFLISMMDKFKVFLHRIF